MTNYSHGRLAEEAAANFLVGRGFTVLAQNWRRRVCEIDIIAQKNNCIYFVEVKYRQTNTQGDGLEYITPQKLKQMSFAAQMWLSENNWSDDYCLSAIEVFGRDFQVGEFIDSVT